MVIAAAVINRYIGLSFPLDVLVCVRRWQLLHHGFTGATIFFVQCAVFLLSIVPCSGVEGPHPPVAGSVLMAPLSISLWHYWTQHDDPAFGWLVSLPAQVSRTYIPFSSFVPAASFDIQAVVLISQCCAHWLAHNPHSHLKHSTVETLLQVYLQLRVNYPLYFSFYRLVLNRSHLQ